MSFEATQAQSAESVNFVSHGQGYTLLLTGDGAVLSLLSVGDFPHDSADRSRQRGTGSAEPDSVPGIHEAVTRTTLRMRLVGANPQASMVGLNELPGKSNYFLGNSPTRWRTNVSHYAKVKAEQVYPGIDLVYYGNPRQLEYDFVVAPAADPNRIRLTIESEVGARRPVPLRIASNGDLVIATGDGEVRFHKPVVYQEEPGTRSQESKPEGKGQRTQGNLQSPTGNRQFLEAHYVLAANNEIRFEVPAYDKTRPLVIDPVLSYSTFLGGISSETGYGIAVDTDGNIFVSGITGSTDFPTEEAYQAGSAGGYEVFVSKLDPSGTMLVYSTYLGGSGFDRAAGLALDSSGNVYLAGETTSNNFPTTTGAFQTTWGGGLCGTTPCADAFVAKLNPDGSALAYSTYLGGNKSDGAQGIAIDGSGNAYVTGSTLSADFPVAAAYQAAPGGNSDVFVTKLNPEGSALVYSTYLGGTQGDFSQAIAVTAAGNATIAGHSYSTDFPTANPLQATSSGLPDLFVAQLSEPGDSLVYSTYLGGSSIDRAFALAVDTAGNTYVAGDTTSADFPVAGTPFQNSLAPGTCGTSPCPDGFVTKIDPSGAALLYSTYLGGSNIDQVYGIAVDDSEDTFVTGFTRSDDFPLSDPFQGVLGGGTCGTNPCPDAFATQLDSNGSSLLYSTFLGGNNADFGEAITLDAGGSAYLTGMTASANYPVTFGALQAARGGSSPTGDAFVAKVLPGDAPSLVLSPQSLTFADQPTGFTSPAQILTLTNVGSAPLNVSSITTTGDFAQTNTCEPTVAAVSGTCTISVTLTPAETGDLSGELTITDDAAGSPHIVPLAGAGIDPAPDVTLSPIALEFPDQTVGTTSDPQTVTLTNTGTAELTIETIEMGGSDFAQTNNCPISPDTLAVGAACTADVTFTPTGTQLRSDSLSFTTDVASSTGGVFAVGLSGTGVAVFSLSAAPTSVTLDRGTGSTTFTVTAAGPSEFTDSISLTCENPRGAVCSFDPATIQVGEESTLTIGNLGAVSASSLTPGVQGTSGDQVAVADLSIIFADFTVAITPRFNTISSGESAVVTMTLDSTNGFAGSASFTCLGLPTESTCTFDPATPSLDGTNAVTVQVTIQTTKRVQVHSLPRWPSPFTPWFMGGLVVLTLAFATGMSRRRVRLGLLVGILSALLFFASCTSYYNYEFRGTFPGTYPISITSQVGESTHAAVFSLTVT